MDEGQQYLRQIGLVFFGNNLNGIDVSQLRIKFSVKRSDTMTPNVADIRIYNMDRETSLKLLNREFNQVVLQAGYQSNYGVIFQGNIMQVIIGRESATDTFVDVVCGDGDLAYNFAVVNATLKKGSTQRDQINTALTPMIPKGVTAGNLGTPQPDQLPRGKAMFGNARNYLRNVTRTTGMSWSIQDGKVNFVPKKGYLPGERVLINSKTGMIGSPQQTNEGVNVKCLLNPNIRIATRVELDNSQVQRLKINLQIPNSPANIPAPLTADGVYYVLVCEHSGDTRGIDWYSSLICLNIDVTTNPLNSVQVGYG